jgi:hypothetical protein
MAIEKRSKSISRRTRDLLDGGESALVDFKRGPDGVHAEDFVSFANSETGGDILVGIAEESGANGAQRGVVIGCDIGDGTVLQILNKAIGCVPPIAIQIFVENTAKTPFLRVHVPPSENRPHSTPKGVYCRRDGSRNRPLHPNELLRIFLDNEGRIFAQRFEDAGQRLANELSSLQRALEERIESIGDQLGWAEMKLDGSENTIDTILARIANVESEAIDSSTRLRALFRQDNRADPVRAEVRGKFLREIVDQLSRNAKILKQIKSGKGVSVQLSGKAALELNESDLKEILGEAVAAVSKPTHSDK